ncbi:uncharacterized protein LOC135839791 [Planococcus citri]|uniref:uncharacterized protein LOC135839791 n=1 Tax=Planococcus citri TaxID=170843 RepID=UPI0031FA46AF
MGVDSSHWISTVLIGFAFVLFATAESDLTNVSSDHPSSNTPINIEAPNAEPEVAQPNNDISIKTPTSDPNIESKTTSEEIPSTPSTKDEIESHLLLLQSQISPTSFDLLSADVLSEPNPFKYLVRKTYKLPFQDILTAISDVKFVLNSNMLPELYIPYVQALNSILNCEIALTSAKIDILDIQSEHQANSKTYNFPIPSSVSSPFELSGSGLFSKEIFFDPDTPLELLRKLLSIPKKNIPYWRARLKDYHQQTEEQLNRYSRQTWWPYIWYSFSLSSVFKDDSILDDMKRDMDILRRISTTAHRSSSSQNAPTPNLNSKMPQLNNNARNDTPTKDDNIELPFSPSNDSTTASNTHDIISASTIKDEIESRLQLLRPYIASKSFNLLSTAILSEADPFQYLLRKTVKLSHMDTWKATSDMRLVLYSNLLPEMYVPYVQALKSLLCCQLALTAAKNDILEIRRELRANSMKSSSIPSPPGLSGSGLFSSDVLDDRNTPLCLINKILRISKENILLLRPNLTFFVQRGDRIYWNVVHQVRRSYMQYCESLDTFFGHESILEDLTRDVENLQQVSTTARGSVLNGGKAD